MPEQSAFLGIPLAVVIISLVMTSGCIHTGTARDIIFPDDEEPIEYRRGTIAEVRHNFTGAFTDTSIPLGSEEKIVAVDNFFIGEGGGDLYVWVQVRFGADPSNIVDFERYVHVRLIYEPGSDEERIITQSLYAPQGSGRYDKAELMNTLNGTSPGLYSLRVDSVGTATQDGDVKVYDWFLISVNGIFSDRSYNNNAPDRF